MSDPIDTIIERLDELESILFVIANRQTRTHNLAKEIQKTMATQADVDAVTAQLAALRTEVAKIGADFTAFANRPGITLEALQTESNSLGAALQALDDQIPEQDPPASA